MITPVTDTIVLIPLKRPAAAKSRLAPWLAPAEREALQRAMADDVIDIVKAARLPFAVVTSDPASARRIARRRGLVLMESHSDGGLDGAITHGLAMLDFTALWRWVIVLPADVPAATAEDLRAVRQALVTGADVVVVPDRHGDGTNALGLTLGRRIRPAFGPGSFARHCALGASARFAVRTLALPSLAVDVDEHDDLELVIGGEGARRTRAALAHSGLADRTVEPICLREAVP